MPRPSWWRDRRGVATIEFALITSLLFAIMLAALDIGMYFIQRGNLASGVATGAVYSFNNRTTVPYASLPAMVSAIAAAPPAAALAVTVECNGSATPCVNESRVCACLTATNSYRQAASCGQSCSGTGTAAGSTSGYYLKISARYHYVPIVVPARLFGNTMLEQAAVVRLQ